MEGLRERSMNRSERKLGGPIKVIWRLVALRWENEGGARVRQLSGSKAWGKLVPLRETFLQGDSRGRAGLRLRGAQD